MLRKILAVSAMMLCMFSHPALAEALKTGPWRFEMKAGYATIPFVIDFRYQGEKLVGTLRNGKEKIELRDIEHDQQNNRLRIPLQTYEQSLELELKDKNTLKGFHVRHNKNPEIRVPVTGIHGVAERFPGKKNASAPNINLDGKWAVELIEEDGTKSQGIVIFDQKGKDLYGSILTPTGDYRYFNGHVTGDQFEAASFDGVFNYLFKGELKDKKLTSEILANYKTSVIGKKDPKASLPDPYKQTQLKELKFKFPNLQGKEISLSDPQFSGKPVVIQFFGSWCPNCMDEMNFLIPWYAENKKRGIEVVALAFERSLSKEDAKRQLRKLEDKKKVNYPLLLAGYTVADTPMDKVKGLKNFISFPTTVFLNRKHEVVKVHAGFTGPSTGEFFEKWKTEFNQTVDKLLKK